MSNMLDQAIIDASALKEAAIKNAETAILEKYSQEIKGAVDSMLDIEESEKQLNEVDPDKIVSDMPLAATHEQGPDDEVMTVNLEELTQEFMEEMQREGQLDAEEMSEHEEVAERLDSEEQLDEEFEIDDAELAEIFEEMEVDITPVKDGHLETPTSQIAAAEAEAEAKELHDDDDEEKKELEESLKKLRKNYKSLLKESKKYKSIILQLKDAVNEVNAQNAKLLYTNQALNSTSLNERQKTKIVEAIDKAGSVEEAKVIYETLQSAVGSSVRENRKPQSLSEAVRTRSSTLLSSRKRETAPASDSFTERMQALAGIKKDN